jgi:hypothetical protein
VVHLIEAQRGNGTDDYGRIGVKGCVLGSLSAGLGGTPSPEEITAVESQLEILHWRYVDLDESELL